MLPTKRQIIVSPEMKHNCARERQPAGAAALRLPDLQESQVEGYKHQDNTDVRHQPFPGPGSMPKEQYVYTNYKGYHQHNVQHDKHASCHFDHLSKYNSDRLLTGRRIFPKIMLGLLLF